MLRLWQQAMCRMCDAATRQYWTPAREGDELLPRPCFPRMGTRRAAHKGQYVVGVVPPVASSAEM